MKFFPVWKRNFAFSFQLLLSSLSFPVILVLSWFCGLFDCNFNSSASFAINECRWEKERKGRTGAFNLGRGCAVLDSSSFLFYSLTIMLPFCFFPRCRLFPPPFLFPPFSASVKSLERNNCCRPKQHRRIAPNGTFTYKSQDYHTMHISSSSPQHNHCQANA